MAYTAKAWTDGDIITADALNNLENGAAQNASDIAEIQTALPNYIGENIPRKIATTYIPNTTDQTIEANQYLSGVQTIKGDTNLTAKNIKSGVSIFGVNGSYESSVGIDTSDATAAASDIADGKTAYVNGTKVTGTVPEGTPSWSTSSIEYSTSTYFNTIKITGIAKADTIVREGEAVGISIVATNFGDATAADVVSGKTFTSDAGLKITGTAVSSGSSISLQTKTITPSTSVQNITPDSGYDGLSSVTVNAIPSDYIIPSGTKTITENGTVDVTNYASVEVDVPANSESSTNNCEAYHITSVSDTLTFQNTAGTIKVWGYGSKGSSYSTTNYAFVGDGYYSGTFGSYTKTTVSFGLNADGTISGIPSDLTTLDVLVTIGV